jgi:DNA-binding MarR family transcriptional regulator
MSITQTPALAAPGESLSDAVQAFRLVLALAQELRTLMDQRLAPSGLTTQQAALLTVIEMLGRPAMTEAARALAMTHQNVKQLATALERKGFLKMVQDDRDARSKRMVTTPRHKAFWAQRNPDDHHCVAQWLSRLDSGEMAMLVRLLAKAMGSARAQREGPRGGHPFDQ